MKRLNDRTTVSVPSVVPSDALCAALGAVRRVALSIALPAALLAVSAYVATAAAAEPETKLELEQTTITGARELPKILYIVPWKKSQPELNTLPMGSLVEETLSPLDMDEFRREVRYHGFLQSDHKP